MRKVLIDREKFKIDRKFFIKKISDFIKEPSKELLKDLIISSAKIKYNSFVDDLNKFESDEFITPNGSGNFAKVLLSESVLSVTKKRIDNIIDVCFIAIINGDNYSEIVSNMVDELEKECGCKKNKKEDK